MGSLLRNLQEADRDTSHLAEAFTAQTVRQPCDVTNPLLPRVQGQSGVYWTVKALNVTCIDKL